MTKSYLTGSMTADYLFPLGSGLGSVGSRDHDPVRLPPMRTSGFTLAVAFWCLSASCADAQGDGGGQARLPAAAARRASAIPVRQAAVSGRDALFTNITGLDLDSRGRIYVSDWDAARVSVLDSTGALVRTIGRRGLGPGEFRSLAGVQLLPGDSLLVYDPAAARVSVFPPDADAPAYVLNLAASLGGAPPFRIERTPDGYVALFRPGFTPDASTPRHDEIRLLDLSGRPRGEVLRSFPSRSFLRTDQAHGFAVMPHPFGGEGLYAVSPDGALHVAWNGAPAVETVAPDGRTTGRFEFEHQPPAVTREDVRRAVAELPKQMAARFRPVLEDSVPPRWPPLRALLADDAGGLWIALNGDSRESVEWTLFYPGGEYRGSVFLPGDVEVLAVRRGRLLGVRKDETGVPTVVTYALLVRPGRGAG